VREFDAGVVGRAYKFSVSKKARAGAEQTNAAAQVVVPISTSGY